MSVGHLIGRTVLPYGEVAGWVGLAWTDSRRGTPVGAGVGGWLVGFVVLQDFGYLNWGGHVFYFFCYDFGCFLVSFLGQ